MDEMNIEEIKKKQLQILKYVHRFCCDNKIKYFLSGGTLLGSIRHKGYIPWDDDIDIMMLREDYEIFCSTFNEKSNEKKIELFTYKNINNFQYPFCKVCDLNTILLENQDLDTSNLLGINIDVFPIDTYLAMKEAKNIYNRISWLRKIFIVKTIKVNWKSRSIWKNLILCCGKIIFCFFNPLFLIKKIDNIAQNDKNIDECKFAGCVVWGYGKQEILPKMIFSDTIEVDFEGYKFYAPKNYHEYLTALYGDYMKLPPIEKRITHHDFKAYYKD